VGEKWDQQKVKLFRVGQVIDAGVAEADGFALRVGKNRDIDIAGERDSDAGAIDSGAEFGASVDVNNDTILLKGNTRRISVDEAGGVAIAAKVVAPVGGIKELSF
jgi:hypothetical protein